MESNLTWKELPNGASAACIVIRRDIYGKVEKFLARDLREAHDNPRRCVRPEYNHVQSEPIVKSRDPYGYDTLPQLIFAVLTGWYWMKDYFRPVYYANSEGLRLIAEYGCPHKAYASLSS
jgi:hypothetical protein